MKKNLTYIIGLLLLTVSVTQALAAGPAGTPPGNNTPDATFNSVSVNGNLNVDSNGNISNPDPNSGVFVSDTNGLAVLGPLGVLGNIFGWGDINILGQIIARTQITLSNNPAFGLPAFIALIFNPTTSDGNISNATQVYTASDETQCTTQGGTLVDGTASGKGKWCSKELTVRSNGIQFKDALNNNTLKVTADGRISNSGNKDSGNLYIDDSVNVSKNLSALNITANNIGRLQVRTGSTISVGAGKTATLTANCDTTVSGSENPIGCFLDNSNSNLIMYGTGVNFFNHNCSVKVKNNGSTTVSARAQVLCWAEGVN